MKRNRLIHINYFKRNVILLKKKKEKNKCNEFKMVKNCKDKSKKYNQSITI